ncbi:hypothetical protein GFJ91_23615, partial [Salmonella enterica subsp. enterica serovar Enteritidis]|nr:hypothetical protein [Salmonella enterica subsp. enterica serovar Enteritidis]
VSWQVLKTVEYVPESVAQSDRENLSRRLRRRKNRELTGSIDDEIFNKLFLDSLDFLALNLLFAGEFFS